MAKAARTVADARDLKAARDAFGALSDAVVAAAKAEGFKDIGEVKLAFCPMANRQWLQKEDNIRNPYYGSAMPDCGSSSSPDLLPGASAFKGRLPGAASPRPRGRGLARARGTPTATRSPTRRSAAAAC